MIYFSNKFIMYFFQILVLSLFISVMFSLFGLDLGVTTLYILYIIISSYAIILFSKSTDTMYFENIKRLPIIAIAIVSSLILYRIHQNFGFDKTFIAFGLISLTIVTYWSLIYIKIRKYSKILRNRKFVGTKRQRSNSAELQYNLEKLIKNIEEKNILLTLYYLNHVKQRIRKLNKSNYIPQWKKEAYNNMNKRINNIITSILFRNSVKNLTKKLEEEFIDVVEKAQCMTCGKVDYKTNMNFVSGKYSTRGWKHVHNSNRQYNWRTNKWDKNKKTKTNKKNKQRKKKEKKHKNQSEQEENEKDIEKYKKILGIEKENIDIDLIQKKYREKAKKNHPDQDGDTEKLKEINKAYEELEKIYK